MLVQDVFVLCFFVYVLALVDVLQSILINFGIIVLLLCEIYLGFTISKLILFLFFAGVGKSCLLLRFSDGSFTTSFITTIGYNFIVFRSKIAEFCLL